MLLGSIIAGLALSYVLCSKAEGIARYEFLLRSTVVPVMLAGYLMRGLFPVLPAVIMAGAGLVCCGLCWKKLWALTLLGFFLLGCLWILLVYAACHVPLD